MAHARMVDLNQERIVKSLRAAGASVCILSRVGLGVPDLLVGFNGINYLLEAKSSAKKKLRKTQVNFSAEWRGRKPVRVNDEWEALRAIGVKA